MQSSPQSPPNDVARVPADHSVPFAPRPLRARSTLARGALCGVVCALLLGGAAGPASAQAGPAITPYSIESSKVSTLAADDAAVVASRPVALDLAALDRLASQKTAGEGGAGQAIALPLFGDRVLELSSGTIEENFVGHTTHAENADGSSATLAWGDGMLFASIDDRGTAYRLRQTPDGPTLELLDLAAYPEDRDDALLPPVDSTEDPQAGADELDRYEAPNGADSPNKDSGARIDVLVVYTPAARSGAGGTGGIRQLINLGMAQTNQASKAGSVVPRVRLVGVQEIAYDEGTRDNGDTLRLLRNRDDGVMDEVHALRDAVRADMVAMVGNALAGSCGVAYLMAGSNNRQFESSAFSYTARQCMGNTRYTFAHELGHNLGCNHAPVDPVGPGAQNYSFGYKDPERRFRTIMAYNCDGGCPRQLRWSNPRQSIGGAPLGTANQDNARSLNSIRAVVANFRQEGPTRPGRLELVQSEIAITEDRPELVVEVRRADGNQGEVRLGWGVTSASAIDGVDFGDGSTSGTLTWSNGEGGTEAIRIPLLDDREVEGDETFVVTLGNPTGGAELGPVTAAAITLVDNDVEPFECAETATTMCLQDGRFEVQVTWETTDGATGEASRVSPRGRDSGMFWFFDQNNWELLLKVLDACSLNEHFWVLFAATTDLGYTIRVTDTEAGVFRTWTNEPGTAAPAVNETSAFATCP